MTTLKINGKVGAAADAALEPYIAKLYATPGLRIPFVGELKQEDRNQPAPDSDTGTWVKVKIASLEIPTADQEHVIRDAHRALYLQRTATGTITEDGQVELDEETLKLTGGLLHAIEAARIKTALRHWARYARRVNNAGELTLSEMRHELDAVASGLTAALDGSEQLDGSDG